MGVDCEDEDEFQAAEDVGAGEESFGNEGWVVCVPVAPVVVHSASPPPYFFLHLVAGMQSRKTLIEKFESGL